MQKKDITNIMEWNFIDDEESQIIQTQQVITQEPVLTVTQVLTPMQMIEQIINSDASLKAKPRKISKIITQNIEEIKSENKHESIIIYKEQIKLFLEIKFTQYLQERKELMNNHMKDLDILNDKMKKEFDILNNSMKKEVDILNNRIEEEWTIVSEQAEKEQQSLKDYEKGREDLYHYYYLKEQQLKDTYIPQFMQLFQQLYD